MAILKIKLFSMWPLGYGVTNKKKKSDWTNTIFFLSKKKYIYPNKTKQNETKQSETKTKTKRTSIFRIDKPIHLFRVNQYNRTRIYTENSIKILFQPNPN